MLSYSEYLKVINERDCRTNWIRWKMEVCGMSEREAIIASFDVEWGYKPLNK